MRSGVLAQEIVPVDVPGHKGAAIRVSEDEHPRADTTAESLAALRPAFRQDGSVTAGNASGVNDGAAALLLASGAAVSQHGLRPLARILAYASAGIAPRVMGFGPVPAVHKLLAQTGLRMQDFDVIELNEAFGAQGLAVMRALGLSDDAPQVNPNGGAIAFGHPLGMSGARLVLAAARQLCRTGGRYGLITLCVGVGQGVAMAIENTGATA
jgi:acetyl-CoA acetyltransferase family protein